jgi:hypothetical protein
MQPLDVQLVHGHHAGVEVELERVVARDDNLAPPFADKRERVFGFCKRQVPPVLHHAREM